MSENELSGERRISLTELAIKVAILEDKAERMHVDMKELSMLLKKHMEDEERERQELLKQLTEMNNLMQRYRGTLGGIVLTITSIFGLIGLGIEYFKR